MSTFDLETTGVASRAPVRKEGSGLDSSTMIGLQRLAGNSAVASAIRSGQIDSAPVELQRLVAGDELDEDEEEEGSAIDDSGDVLDSEDTEEEAEEEAEEESEEPGGETSEGLEADEDEDEEEEEKATA
jgi:hypothetical protein